MAERRGTRLIPMNSFFVLPKDGLVKENVLQPGELITEILRCAARRDPLHLSECARASVLLGYSERPEFCASSSEFTGS